MKEPTLKQKKAFKEITENHRSVSAAMRKAGYSESSATKPSNLTNTDGWQELMDKYLPDSSLARVHKQLLNSATLDKVSFSKKVSDKDIEASFENIPGVKLVRIVPMWEGKKIVRKTAYVHMPDNMARDKALDKAYKLKAKYAPEKHTVDGSIIFLPPKK